MKRKKCMNEKIRLLLVLVTAISLILFVNIAAFPKSNSDVNGMISNQVEGTVKKIIQITDQDKKYYAVLSGDEDKIYINVFLFNNNNLVPQVKKEEYSGLQYSFESKDIDQDKHSEIIYKFSDGGSGSSTEWIWIYSISKKEAYDISADLDYGVNDESYSGKNLKMSANLKIKGNEKILNYMTGVLMKDGYISKKPSNKELNVNPNLSCENWLQDNKIVSSGKLKLKWYSGKPPFYGTVEQVIKYGRYSIEVQFKNAVYKYDPTENRFCVLYIPQDSSYDWFRDMKIENGNLLINENDEKVIKINLTSNNISISKGSFSYVIERGDPQPAQSVENYYAPEGDVTAHTLQINANGQIFYVNNNQLLKYDGSKEAFSQENAQGRILSINAQKIICLLNNYVYYQDTDYRIEKIKTDGTGRKVICNDLTGFVIPEKDMIYYSNSSDADKLYKIKPDGSGKKKVVNDNIFTINKNGDWIYYINVSPSYKIQGKSRLIGKLYRIKTDSSNREQITNEDISLFVIYKDMAVGKKKGFFGFWLDSLKKTVFMSFDLKSIYSIQGDKYVPIDKSEILRGGDSSVL